MFLIIMCARRFQDLNIHTKYYGISFRIIIPISIKMFLIYYANQYVLVWDIIISVFASANIVTNPEANRAY